jgi:hypothetical protein
MMGENRFLLGIVRAVVCVVALAFLHHFLFLLRFPLLVELFLLVSEQGNDLAVGILEYGAAVAVVVSFVAGWVIAEAVHGNGLGNEDDLNLKHLILSEVELIFQHSQEAGCPFCGVGLEWSWLDGGVGCLGMD